MIFAHLTSNTMLCDNTFLCPRRLFSSSISPWLCSPQPWEATKLPHFQPPGVHKEPGMGEDYESHLCCHLDNTSPRLAFTSTSTAASWCPIPRLEGLVPVSPCSCPPRGLQLFHSQVNFTLKNVLAKAFSTFTSKSTHSQDRACKCTFDFHSEVTSPLKNVLANALVTFTRKSLHRCLHPILEGLPLWHGFLLWRSHPALASLILP